MAPYSLYSVAFGSFGITCIPRTKGQTDRQTLKQQLKAAMADRKRLDARRFSVHTLFVQEKADSPENRGKMPPIGQAQMQDAPKQRKEVLLVVVPREAPKPTGHCEKRHPTHKMIVIDLFTTLAAAMYREKEKRHQTQSCLRLGADKIRVSTVGECE